MTRQARAAAATIVEVCLRIPRTIDQRIAQGCIANARVAAIDSRRHLAMRKILENEELRPRKLA